MKAIPISLPDALHDFTGSAAELAGRCNEVLEANGLADERGVANERLVRHYVQLGVLTPPVRRGREALFGARQVAEFVVARMLLRDGWPLAKIAELMGTYDFPLPAAGDADEPRASPTAAERAIARMRVSDESPPMVKASRLPDSLPLFSRRPVPDSASTSLPDPLDRATDLAAGRADLAETLRSLGNPAGRAEKSDMVRIRLTPWLNVDVDPVRLRELGPDAEEALGRALTEALRQQRVTRGEDR